MANLIEKIFRDIVVIQRSNYKLGIINTSGQTIVPFGRYDWIDDFDQGLARVKICNKSGDNADKWGIINEAG